MKHCVVRCSLNRQKSSQIRTNERNETVHEGIVVPIFFFVCVAAIWGAYILTRHKERMVLIDKGTGAEEIKSLYSRNRLQLQPLTNLKWGIVLVGIGIAILLAMWLQDTFMFRDGVYPGLIALLGGLGLIVFYFVARRKQE